MKTANSFKRILLSVVLRVFVGQQERHTENSSETLEECFACLESALIPRLHDTTGLSNTV